ncbi:c-type cytochrome [Crocinitomix algicola]|uniref:c-type cytochrome n=1 Tax=Crocinitomix algicola TaxID=1740263 RepID=UPI000872238C|nr:cytochrome c [Crocinitomix algicola]
MSKIFLQFTLFFLILVTGFSFIKEEGRIGSYQVSNNVRLPQTVEDALLLSGSEYPNHYIEKLDLDSARMGEEMIRYGALLDGSNTRISKYFVCTDCHNLVMESEDPSDESPDAVLKYGKLHDIPYLPASTFYGMYNKSTWYNDDYLKKYGDLVYPARDSLVNAIQLCATQCSQGRPMESWEIRSVLHYYKSIQLKIEDLNFTAIELKQFLKHLDTDKHKALAQLKGKYNQANRAHFGTNKIPEIPGYTPNYENGRYVYTKGCLHCHDAEKGITNFTLSNSNLSLNYLHRKKDKYNNLAVPHITRYGTYAMSGRKQYMPMYSFEKLSEEQMLDLLYYIKTGIKK